MDGMNTILCLNEYSIYKCDNYYLCIPNNDNNFYHVFMGFTFKDLTQLSEEELLFEIRKISDSINAVYKNGIYVLPIIEPTLLDEVTLENDDRGYNRLLRNVIQPITLSVYSKLISKNKRVSQIIKVIKQNDKDKKLVGWLSMKLGSNFIKEITFEIQDKVDVDNTIKEDVFIDMINISATDYQIDEIWLKQEEDKINDTLKPAFSPGFSALKFLLMVLGISLVFGVILGYLIMK